MGGGTFAAFYTGVDTSPTITTLSIQGSSTSFDGTTLLSTSAFVVLTSTDPLVNGFASGAATTYYRIDRAVAGSTFQVYTSSVPLPLGVHTIDYYSQDWAGNNETIHTSTMLVTAGTLFKSYGQFATPGKLLAGFVDYGNKVDIQSAAQFNNTLIVSSANLAQLVTIQNIGLVGVGRAAPEANLDVSSGPLANGAALLLRSGNQTSTSSVQIAFGYNGDVAMSHLLTTQHSTATLGNLIDLALWTPVAGSTTSRANIDALAILASTITIGGGSVHIAPAGNPDVELEVSNRATTGGGTIHRIASAQPSSRAIKSHIRYFSGKDEDRAFKDVLELRHARFRYKRLAGQGALVDDPSLPLYLGLIYEDAPQSIRGPGNSITIDDRLINVEIAIKKAAERVETLKTRLAKLKEAR